MKHVEYSQRPARYEVRDLPHGEKLLLFRENIVPGEATEGESWSADEYALTVRGRKNLEADLESHFGDYLERAKAAEYAELAAEIRAKRDALLAETDYLFQSDYPIWDDEREPWRVYRQALRNVPEQAGFPYEVVWPVKPER